MSTHKHIDKICVVVIILAMLLTVAFMNGERLGIEAVVDEDAESFVSSEYFTENDLDGDWDASNPTAAIALNGDSVKISGNGVYYNDGEVVITGAGKYVFSGTLTDGSIVVDAYASSKVWILLDGVDIYCSDNAAIRVEQAEKVFLTLAEGSENSLESGSEYTSEALNDNVNAALWAADDLTINGSGSLTVTAGYKHGIKCKDSLTITGGTIVIDAPQDGIHSNDEFLFTAADLTINAGDDAIHSDIDIYVESGTILVNECYEGFEAPIIDIAGGDITLYPSDDGFNANGGSSTMMGMGGMGGGMPADMGTMPGQQSTESSEEGSTERAENANSAEASGTENAGTEPPAMPDGEMPSDMGEMPELPADMQQSTDVAASDIATSDAESEETYIRISGGSITIINETGNDADGLDSNGDIYITGGDIRISLANTGSNSAIDYASENNGVCEISGGTVIACGSYSMAEHFDTSSAQCSVLYNFSSGAEAGTLLQLLDADGNVLLSWEVPCSFSSANLSCPEMQSGETYTVVIGDQYEEITLSDVSASYGDAQSTGFGGRMNFGGMSQMSGGSSDGQMNFGGHGGKGSRPGQSSSEGSGSGSDSSSERPTPPDWNGSGDGELPDFPEGFDPFSSDGDSSERPTPPDWSSESSEDQDEAFWEDVQEMLANGDFEAPDWSSEDGSSDSSQMMGGHGGGMGGQGGSGNTGMPGGFADQQTGDAADEETTVSTAVALSELDSAHWLWIGGTLAVLILGLAVALLYKRR